jgi:Acetyltransferase (GNAT) domain
MSQSRALWRDQADWQRAGPDKEFAGRFAIRATSRKQTCFMVTISEEKIVDYEITARIATEAFGSKDVVFSGERVKWLYERSFGQGSTILSAFDGDVKVGQMALIHQKLRSGGEAVIATQLVDLFIVQAHRSPQLVRRLYKEVERLCLAQNIRFLLGVPNENAKSLNARLLKLNPLFWLPIRAGLGMWWPRGSRLKYSGHFKSMAKQDAIDLLSSFATSAGENGLQWDGETLFDRLSDPTCDYAVHATADLLLISSSRMTKGVRYAMLCGFFVRPQATATPDDIRTLIGAACRHWKHAFFVYVGVNNSLPVLPGFVLPTRLRAPMLVQLRDFTTDKPDMRFDRFQLIDTDFV